MFAALKQKRIIIIISGVVIVLVGAGIFVASRTAQKTATNSPTTTQKNSTPGQNEVDGQAAPDDKKDPVKEDKKTADKPATQSTGGGGAQVPATNGGGGGTTIPGGSNPPGTSVLYGWQLTAQNTGLAPHGLSCNGLPLYTGPSKPSAGTVISQKRVETPLDLSNGNITIEKSCIRPTSVGTGLPIVTTTDYNNCNPDCGVTPSSVTIRDSEINGTSLGAEESAFATGFLGVGSLYRNYIHGMGSGIGIANSGTQISITIEGNYVTGLTAFGDPGTTGNHSDAFTIRDFITTSNPNRRATIINNRFNCDSGNDTGAFFIQQTWNDNIDYVAIEGNLLEGEGYQLALEGNTYGTHMSAVNNRFSGTGYGPALVQGSGPGWATWSNNFINNPSATNNQGAAVPKP